MIQKRKEENCKEYLYESKWELFNKVHTGTDTKEELAQFEKTNQQVLGKRVEKYIQPLDSPKRLDCR